MPNLSSRGVVHVGAESRVVNADELICFFRWVVIVGDLHFLIFKAEIRPKVLEPKALHR